jgi:hypothetical protein
MNDDAVQKYLVTMHVLLLILILILIHFQELAAVGFRIRANACSAIPFELFFSCSPRISHMDYISHFGDMHRLHFGLLMTWLRTFLRLSPGLEAGTKRQKHADVVVDSLPADHSPSAIPMGHRQCSRESPLRLCRQWSPHPPALLMDQHTAD